MSCLFLSPPSTSSLFPITAAEQVRGLLVESGVTKACVVLKIGLQYTIAADLRTRPLGALGFKVDISARQNAAQKPGRISFNLFFGFWYYIGFYLKCIFLVFTSFFCVPFLNRRLRFFLHVKRKCFNPRFLKILLVQIATAAFSFFVTALMHLHNLFYHDIIHNPLHFSQITTPSTCSRYPPSIMSNN